MRCEPPNDVVINVVPKSDGVEKRPKLNELAEVVGGERSCQVNLGDPRMVMEGLCNLPIFPFGGFEDERSDINWLSPAEPRGKPKGRFLPISNSDRSGGIEDIHILLVARVTVFDPNLVGVFPLKPWPTKAESRSKFVRMKDSKPT
jgi:hypothetical protein